MQVKLKLVCPCRRQSASVTLWHILHKACSLTLCLQSVPPSARASHWQKDWHIQNKISLALLTTKCMTVHLRITRGMLWKGFLVAEGKINPSMLCMLEAIYICKQLPENIFGGVCTILYNNLHTITSREVNSSIEKFEPQWSCAGPQALAQQTNHLQEEQIKTNLL